MEVDRRVLEAKLLPELQEIGLALDIEGVKKFRKKELIEAILTEAGVAVDDAAEVGEKPQLAAVPELEQPGWCRRGRRKRKTRV